MRDYTRNPRYVYKDAVFISTHKLVGGVGGPGVLVAKKRLFSNAVPAGASTDLKQPQPTYQLLHA